MKDRSFRILILFLLGLFGAVQSWRLGTAKKELRESKEHALQVSIDYDKLLQESLRGKKLVDEATEQLQKSQTLLAKSRSSLKHCNTENDLLADVLSKDTNAQCVNALRGMLALKKLLEAP